MVLIENSRTNFISLINITNIVNRREKLWSRCLSTTLDTGEIGSKTHLILVSTAVSSQKSQFQSDHWSNVLIITSPYVCCCVLCCYWTSYVMETTIISISYLPACNIPTLLNLSSFQGTARQHGSCQSPDSWYLILQDVLCSACPAVVSSTRHGPRSAATSLVALNWYILFSWSLNSSHDESDSVNDCYGTFHSLST